MSKKCEGCKQPLITTEKTCKKCGYVGCNKCYFNNCPKCNNHYADTKNV